MKDIAIIGKGGFGREVRFLIEEINKQTKTWNFLGYFDDDKAEPIDGHSLLGSILDIKNCTKEICLVVAIGDSHLRKKIVKSIHNPLVNWPILIHPSVQMDSDRVQIGEGAIICGNSILTTNISIGNYLILNLDCTIGHDVKIGDYCSVMPNVNISGDVVVGDNCFFGTGVKIINDKSIGNNAILGAGAIVIKDIPDNSVAVGNPAKIIKINEI